MGDPDWFRPVYVLSEIWQSTGWGTIIYLAALTTISPELHESAVVDGANKFQRILHIDIPGIMPTAVILLILSTGLAIIIYPLYFVVLASVTDPSAVQMTLFWPEKFSLEGYKKILDSDNLWVAYALSRKDMEGRNTIMLVITFTMFFSGGLIPTYLTVKELGLLDSVWAMVIPNAVGAWNLIIARTFFQSTIPDELLEAAKIDGCSDAKFFWMMVLPLSQALIAIMVLFYGVAHWNSYFNALIYLRDQELFPLQLVLRSILIENQIHNDMMTDLSSMGDQLRAAELIKYGMIIIAALPLLILYPFLQNYFVKGVMIGSIKG
ncbi:hypothetical protein G195_003903 [Phytophthora kernoviae 00238/432]|nr:hypothetical protein G195_003903 [Phytophthora kernoviae 00238/432]